MAPTGGEIDKTPPTIIESYPTNGTTNFKEKELEFSFSEYVNKRNMTEAFFVSPLLEKKPEFSWTGKTVSVEFREELSKNTTYSVIIGTEISDVNNNNKMKEPYILTFSTGAKIDSGIISGQVFGNKIDGTLIFAYNIDTGRVNIYEKKPSYLSQVNEIGKFTISGMRNGNYEVYAIYDEFKDFVYNIGSDKIGFTNKNVMLSDLNKKVENLKFFTHKEDTLKPSIQSVTMTDKNHIVIEFDEAIDSSQISEKNFVIQDSTLNQKFNIKYFFKTNSKKQEYILCLNDSLDIESELYLTVSNIFDKKNNLLEYQSYNFVASDRPDTNNIQLDKVLTKYEQSKIDYLHPEFRLIFSDAFDTTLINDAVTIYTSDSLKIPVSVKFPSSSTILVKCTEDLKEKEEYTIDVNMKNFIDIAGNRVDTILTKNISTVSELDFTGASGYIRINEPKKVNVILKEIGKTKKIIETTANNKVFNFERILPGEYQIWTYIDEDSNGIYSHGSYEPKKYSESFYYYPDTLNLRARWPVGDIELNFIK